MDEKKTSAAGVSALRAVPPGASVPPIAKPEPSNADLAQQMVSLGAAFDEHRSDDRKGFDDLKTKTNWQTFWLGVIVASASIIGALAR